MYHKTLSNSTLTFELCTQLNNAIENETKANYEIAQIASIADLILANQANSRDSWNIQRAMTYAHAPRAFS